MRYFIIALFVLCFMAMPSFACGRIASNRAARQQLSTKPVFHTPVRTLIHNVGGCAGGVCK